MSAKKNTSSRREYLRLMESLCDQYEDLWQQENSPELSKFIANHTNSLSRDIVAELIQIDLNYFDDTGKFPDPDTYVKGLGEFGSVAQYILESHERQRLEPISFVEFGEKSYEIQEQIGAGGMAQIFRGFDRRLGRMVAIKKMRSDLLSNDSAKERFQSEAKIVAAIRDEGIVRIHDVGIQDNELFIVFELLEGGSLAEKISGKPFSPRSAAEFARKIATTMEEAHRVGIVHLDLKPSNILLTRNNEPKIGDFGLALLNNDVSVGKSTAVLTGTPNYMAPEQAAGKTYQLDAQTDIWGIGSVLYEMLTGRPLFVGETSADTIARAKRGVLTSPKALFPSIPVDLDRICMKCLAQQRTDRYASAIDVANDLYAFLTGRPTAANPVGVVNRIWKWTKRNRQLTCITAIASLAIVTILIGSFIRISNERDRFRDQRDTAVANLYDSLVGEARAVRLAGRNGFRQSAWQKLQQAIALNIPNIDQSELRDEIVAGIDNFTGQQPVILKSDGNEGLFIASAIHPGSKFVAFGMSNGSIIIRQLSDGHEIAKATGHRSGIFEIVFNSQGNRMASADDSGLIRIWAFDDLGNCQLEKEVQGPAPKRQNYVKTVSLAFAEDDLLSCPFGNHEIQRWSLDTAADVAETEFVSTSPLIRFSLSNDAKKIAAVTGENEILLVDRSSGKFLKRWSLKDERQLLDVVFSPNDKKIAAGSLNGAYVFDVDSGDRVFALPGDHLITLSFAPDNQSLALPSEDLNLVRIWNVVTNREIAVLENDAYEAQYSPDGSKLVCIAATQISIWNLFDQESFSQLTFHDQGVTNLGFFDDDNLLFTTDEGGTVAVHAFDSNKPIHSSETAMSLVSAYEALGICIFVRNDRIEFHEFPINANQDPILSFEHQLGKKIWDAQLTPNGKLFVAVGSNGVRTWRVAQENSRGEMMSLSVLSNQMLFDKYAGSLCISYDGRLIAWVDYDRNVHVWDVLKRKKVSLPELSASIPGGLAFIPGKRTLAAAAVDGSVTTWDFDRGAAGLTTLISKPGEAWQKVQISIDPTGRRLAAQQGSRLSIWDLPTGRKLFTFPISDDLPWSIAWSSDGNRIALGFSNSKVATWNLKALNERLGSFGLAWDAP